MPKHHKNTTDQFKQLENAGYTVITRTGFHWQVTDGKLVVDVWPTVKKCMRCSSAGPARIYKNVVGGVNKELEHFEIVDIEPTGDEIKWRHGLDWLRSEIEKL